MKTQIILAVLLATAVAVNAEVADGIWGVSVNNNDIYLIDPVAGTLTTVGIGNSFPSAGSAVNSTYHYAENYSSGTKIERYDVASNTGVTFTRDYSVSGSNNNMAVDKNGTIIEIDRNTKNLYSLAFNENTLEVSRTKIADLGVTIGQFGDIAYGPDGLLYIATNNPTEGNLTWDGTTLTKLDDNTGWNGIAWYKGKLYGSLSYEDSSSPSGWTGELYELAPATMGPKGDWILQVGYRLNDLGAWPKKLEVDIDIKPGSFPNSFNIDGNGVIPMAILGSADFDVTTIDPATLTLGGLEVAVRGKNKLMISYEDVNGDYSTSPEGQPDGYLDLVVKFEDDPDFWKEGTSDGTLTGELYDGTPFTGSDSINVVKDVTQ